MSANSKIVSAIPVEETLSNANNIENIKSDVQLCLTLSDVKLFLSCIALNHGTRHEYDSNRKLMVVAIDLLELVLKDLK